MKRNVWVLIMLYRINLTLNNATNQHQCCNDGVGQNKVWLCIGLPLLNAHIINAIKENKTPNKHGEFDDVHIPSIASIETVFYVPTKTNHI